MPELSDTERLTCVPTFESTEELWRGLHAKANFEHADLYPRDGSELQGRVEGRLAELAGVNPDEILVYNSGMSAVTDSIDAALYAAAPKAETLPTLYYAEDTYSQTKRYIENFLQGTRANAIAFDSGHRATLEAILSERQPDVIVAETISNYINVPVLDVDLLLERSRDMDNPPVIVLDNTLPLSTGQPLGEKLNEDDWVIAVESGTKSYTFNRVLSGVGYSQNSELLQWLRRYRRTRGSLPDPGHMAQIEELLPESRSAFDERNNRLFKATGAIAVTLAEAAGDDTRYVISHPAVAGHENHGLYESAYPHGGSPIMYVYSAKITQQQILEKLWDHPGVREQARLGQSFGFDEARLVPDEFASTVRIAGGAYTDGKALGEACAEALYG